jgi:hypothetical protein
MAYSGVHTEFHYRACEGQKPAKLWNSPVGNYLLAACSFEVDRRDRVQSPALLLRPAEKDSSCKEGQKHRESQQVHPITQIEIVCQPM